MNMEKPPYSVINLASIFFALSSLADEGKKVSVEDVRNHASAGDLWHYIGDLGAKHYFGFQNLSAPHWEEFRAWYVEQIKENCHGMEGSERRKYGIENNGICLLISYTAEILQSKEAGENLKLR
jgi:hypothetical protein